MSDTKISIADASNMSLDDYISASGIKLPTVSKKKRNYSTTSFDHLDITDMDAPIPDASSQQWRLIDPIRPVGMPPLIPSCAKQKVFNGNKQHYKNNNNHRRNYNAPYADRDIPAIRKNRQNFKNNARQNAIYQAGLRNAMNANAHSNALMPIQSNAIVAMNQISQNLVGMVAPLLSSGSYENMFTQMMEQWEQRRSRKPKYDMTVQQEISEIQGKPLYFTCTSGMLKGVVSCDGPGVEDCSVKAQTTQTSMHQRFA